MKKVAILFLSLIILTLIAFPAYSVSAEEKCTVTIDTVKGNTGEIVYVPVTISNNPGISAIAVTFTYNSKALEFIKHSKGPAFTDSLMIKDHPDKNQIKIALVETYNDSMNNDVILTFHFKIKEKASAEFHKIDLECDKGDFANRKMESVMPKIVSGGVDVAYNPAADNCPHKLYGNWTTAVKPLCTKGGIDQRICTKCGHIDTKETEPAGHTYDKKWTVDIPAKKDKEGVMSRHCKYCTSTTDSIVFTYSDSQKEDLNNSIGAQNDNNYTDKLFSEQYPESVTQSQSSSTNKETSSPSSKEESKIQNTSSDEAESKVQNISSPQVSSDSQNNKDEGSFFQNNKFLILIFGIFAIVILLVIITFTALKK